MFAVEVYVHILQHLSRADLEALQHVDVYSRDVVATNFATDGPKHSFHTLRIHRHACYAVYRMQAEKFDQRIVVHDDEELKARMKFATVERVRFDWDITMDDDLLQALDPIKSSWQNAECFPPYRYSSSAVHSQAFDELFLCKEMTVGIMCKVPRTFLSLKGVQQCHTVRMGTAIAEFDAADVAAWLHREATGKEVPYDLEINHRSVDVESLMDILKETFLAARDKCSYSLDLHHCPVRDDEKITLHNHTTSELLVIEKKCFKVPSRVVCRIQA